MGLIRILSPAMADRIAAGEVVERPASVLRELIDNSLDAGASRLDIDLEAGGRAHVAVADDGSGLDPDDAVLAFERHATSKIRQEGDLDAVASLGFRGEALAAIAAVSRVELLTRRPEEAEATRVRVERGRLLAVDKAARAPGTTVSVRDLFAGIPARRKFLKSPGTELDHLLAAVIRAGLARPETGFKVRHEGKTLLACVPGEPLEARVATLLGARWAGGLVRSEGQQGGTSVVALASRADLHRPGRDGIHLFVNRRPVRDPLLVRAVLDAYRPVLPAGRFPVVVVYLQLPFSEVDVNVHPAKAEVRFHNPQEVRTLVVGVLSRGLASPQATPRFHPVPPALPAPGIPRSPAAPFSAGDRPPGGSPPDLFQGVAEGPGSPSGEGDRELPGPDIRVIAQYRNCFILAEDGRGLVIVDQHVAHERLLFEQLLRQVGQGALPRQRLLYPLTLELPPEGAAVAERERGLLEKLGFGFDPFGPGTVIVREVPSIFGRSAPAEGFLELVQRLLDGVHAGAEANFHNLLATVACHSAVRKGMPLGGEQMAFILRGLAACEAPSHCPHGRAVSLRVDLGPLEKNFGR